LKNFQTVADLSETTIFGPYPPRELAFHPHHPRLATLGEKDTVIRIWDIDMDVLLGQTAADSVRYTTAKLVLVGDSGVGKTGLGWRLAHREFKEHASTHGQQFWVIDDLCITLSDGTQCEAVLWDLAGQHVYRPIHAIFLDDVDASLVLFDPTNRQEPLKGAEFWLEQLAHKKKLPPSVLVGARLDRGAAVLSQAELAQFCGKHGISGGYIGTSAKEGHGLNELLEILKNQIPWDEMTTTVTTRTFKRVKEYVLGLKEKPDRRGVLVDPAELRRQLEATDPDWRFTDAEMMTAVGHLQTHGYVTILRSSSGQEHILLTPELLVDLASSVVLQADKHPRDLGALSEIDLLQGRYPFAELADLDTGEQQILLDGAVVRFLEHNICFRETLGADTVLIFPGLIKQKRPLQDEVEAVDDISYLVRGRVENIYPALVVLLGFTRAFTRVNQWQRQAQYEMADGNICGFRLIEDVEGEIELVLYYSTTMPEFGQTMFQGLFEQFLYQRDVEVTRFPPVLCPRGHLQERSTVVKRIREGKKFLHCEECGDRIDLPDIEQQPTADAQEVDWIRREEALARLRSAYETHLTRVKGFRRDRAAPRCYVSHLPAQAEWVARLTDDLRDAGVHVLTDLADLTGDDPILIADTLAYQQSFKRSAEAIAADADLIRTRLKQGKSSTIIHLLLESKQKPPPSDEFRPGDFRRDSHYAVSLFDLVLTLYAIAHNDPAFVPLRESLHRQWEKTLAGMEDESDRQIYISYAWGGDSEALVNQLDDAFQARGVTIVRDKRDLGFKGRIKAFMESIGQGKCVILVISEKYLKSENCLFELLQVAKHGEFTDRIFPMVLDDARIYKAKDRIRYVRYWEQQINRAVQF
jgi:small GTP-binding protein